MLNKDKLKTIGGDIYNELSDRKIMVKTVWYFPGKIVMKIPLRMPIRDGIIFIEIPNDYSNLILIHQSFWGSFFGKRILAHVEIEHYNDLNSIVTYVCDIVEASFHKRTCSVSSLTTLVKKSDNRTDDAAII